MFLRLIPRLTFPVLTTQQVRHAGHNKWSNIKHIKGARDAELQKRNALYTFKINLAIKDNGGNTNIETNSALKKIVNEALAQQVPKATVERQIKNYKSNTDAMSEFIVEVRGPGGRVGVLIQCLAAKRNTLDVKLNPILRKHGSSQEFGIANMFEKKGVIITDLKKGATFDDAESDAIEVGAEEVNLVDEESNILEFTTGEHDLAAVSQELAKAGYTCKDASIAYIPFTETELNNMESRTLQKLVDKLMEESCVVAVHSNSA